MPNRIEARVNPGLFDAQGNNDSQRIRNSLGMDIDVEFRKVYTEETNFFQVKGLLLKLINQLIFANHPKLLSGYNLYIFIICL